MYSSSKINRMTAAAIFIAILSAAVILFCSTSEVHAENGPSSKGGIYVGYTHIADGVEIYRGSSSKKSASYNGFKYTKSNNTLTLSKLSETAGSADYYLEVWDMGDDFRIKVSGTNSLGYIGVYSTVKNRMGLAITGTGKLTVNRDGSYGAAIHAYADGKSNNKITIDNTVNLNLYGGENIFTGKKEKVIVVENAKSSSKSDVFRIGGKKTGSTTVKKKKSKKGYTYTYGGYKLVIKKSGKSMLGSSGSKSTNSTKTKTTKKYSISYTLNGGTNSSSNPGTYTGSKQITLKNPTRKGYTFNGWYTTKSFSSKSKISYIKKGSKGNLHLYAKWTKIQYTISYELDGGDNASANPGKYDVTQKVTFADATKKGYEFKGWYTKKDFSSGSKITEIKKGSTGNLKLYAKWKLKMTEYYVPDVESLRTNKDIDTLFVLLEEGMINAEIYNKVWCYTFTKGDRILRIPAGFFENNANTGIPESVNTAMTNDLNNNLKDSTKNVAVVRSEKINKKDSRGEYNSYNVDIKELSNQWVRKGSDEIYFKCTLVSSVRFVFTDRILDITEKTGAFENGYTVPDNAVEYRVALSRYTNYNGSAVIPGFNLVMRNPEYHNGNMYLHGYYLEGMGIAEEGISVSDLVEVATTIEKAASALINPTYKSIFTLFSTIDSLSKEKTSDKYKNSGEHILMSHDDQKTYSYAYRIKSPISLMNEKDSFEFHVFMEGGNSFSGTNPLVIFSVE